MAPQQRLRTRGSARARRILSEVASEIREARMAAGLSQSEVGRRAGLSRDKVWRVEQELLATLSITDACVLAAVLGLDFAARMFPNGHQSVM